MSVTGQDPAPASELREVDPRSGAPEPGTAAAAAAADDAQMLRYAAGDAQAFDALYARYRGPVYRFFLRQLCPADAEECLQEVWLKVIHARSSYQPRGEFKAWLFTIAHRTLTDRHRRQMKHAVTDPDTLADDIADPAADPEAATGHRLEAEHLFRLVAELPYAQREVLLMKEQAGFSLGEIARITGATEEGVKSRLRYAMQKLRQAVSRS